MPWQGLNSLPEDALDIASLCGNDTDLTDALSRALFLNPGRIEASTEELEKQAHELEKKGDKLRARINYETAGRLALAKSDVESVRRCFSRSADLETDEHLIKIFRILASEAVEAVDAATKYYQMITFT
jgi:hypothetical protein